MNDERASRGGKQRLLDAAAELISAHGVKELTIEAVAAAAGVTKGGLIYHFKTKDDLLGALVERMVEQVELRSRDKAAKRGNTTAALLQALVDDTFDMPRNERQLWTNLLAAAAGYPHLHGPVQQLFDRLYGDLAKAGEAAGLALAIGAALDGISLLELLNLHHFTKKQRDAMRQALLNVVRDTIR